MTPGLGHDTKGMFGMHVEIKILQLIFIFFQKIKENYN